jgi:hypothetical protein
VLEGKTLEVVFIDDRLEEGAEWWEPEPMFKIHYQVTLEKGREVGIFRNYKTGSWYKAQAQFGHFKVGRVHQGQRLEVSAAYLHHGEIASGVNAYDGGFIGLGIIHLHRPELGVGNNVVVGEN